jgi:hypothetical protein
MGRKGMAERVRGGGRRQPERRPQNFRRFSGNCRPIWLAIFNCWQTFCNACNLIRSETPWSFVTRAG